MSLAPKSQPLVAPIVTVARPSSPSPPTDLATERGDEHSFSRDESERARLPRARYRTRVMDDEIKFLRRPVDTLRLGLAAAREVGASTKKHPVQVMQEEVRDARTMDG